MTLSAFFSGHPRLRKSLRKNGQTAKGQSIVEYAGMIVLSTLMVGGMMSGTKQVLPVLFTVLSHKNALALSDAPPLPAASLPSPAPDSSITSAHTTGSSTGVNGSSAVLQIKAAIPSTVFTVQATPPLAMTENNPEPKPNQLAALPTTTAHPAPNPSIAPPPNVASGPAPAPPTRPAPGPALAPTPRLAPSPMPAPAP